MTTLYTTNADGEGPISTSDGLVLWNIPPPSVLISQAVSVSESPWTIYWANNGTPAETTTFSFWWIPEAATAAAAASTPTLAPSQTSQIPAATGTTLKSSTASAYPTSTGATPSRSHAVAAAASSSRATSSTPTPYMPSAAQQSADLANEKSDTPMIIGAVLGTVIFFALLGCGAWFLLRRHRRGALVRRRDNGEAGLGGSSNKSQVEKGYPRKLSTTSTSTTTYVPSSPSSSLSPSSGSEGAQSPSRPREVDLIGVIQRTTRSATESDSDPFDDDDDRSTTPTPTSIQMRMMIPSALVAPSSMPLELCGSDSGRPESTWTDDSEFDVMAIDGSSFTRTLSTVSSSNSTLVPEDGGTVYTTTPSIDARYTYLSSLTSSAPTSGRPNLFHIDTATTFNPWPARPISVHMSSIGSSIPTPPYSSSPVDSYNTHGSHSSASRSGSGPSATSSPTLRSSRSPITPVTRRNPFADSFRPRQSLESIRSEVPPAYTELYREDGSRV